MHPIIDPILIARFWERVECGPSCWRWTGHIHSQTGYGSFCFRDRSYRAHRLSLMIHGHEVPDGMDACHHCDNRWCVNPDHLYIGTRQQNMADCTARNRHNKPKGSAHPRAKLSDDDVRNIRLLRAAGTKVIDLAAKFNVNHGTISRIARREWRTEV